GAAGGFTSDRAAIEEIRRRIARLRSQFPRVEAGVTGGPALSNDEMRVALADSTLATALAVGLTLGLPVLAFRRVGEPRLMLAVLALSLSWSLGVVALTIGHLTVFSVIFISIVIGLGIDYGIYVLARMDEEMTLGRGPGEALEVTAARSGPGILLGAMTAVATFASLGLTDFHGVQELGLISGIALLLAFAGMLTVFPAALMLRAGRPSGTPSGAGARALPTPRRRVRAIDILSRRPGPVLAGAALLTAVSVWSARDIDFDYNLLHLHASGVESVAWEHRIVAAQTRSSLAALASATSLPELRRKRDAFARLDTVQDVDSALLLIPDDQDARLVIIADIAAVVRHVSLAPAPRPDVDRM